MNHSRAPRKEKRHRESKFVDTRSNYAAIRKVKRTPVFEPERLPEVRARAVQLRPIAPKLPTRDCPYGHSEEITCPICDLLE